MMNNMNDMNDMTYRRAAAPQIAEGAAVYDVNGEKLGKVAELDPQNDGFLVEKGHFFTRDFPVPMSAVARADADGVYLNVSKDDATDGKWGDSAATLDPRDVDTQTPYLADAAQSVGDRDLNIPGSDVQTNAYPADDPLRTDR